MGQGCALGGFLADKASRLLGGGPAGTAVLLLLGLQHGVGRGVDFVVIFGIAHPEFNIVDLAAVLPVQLAADGFRVGSGNPGVGEGGAFRGLLAGGGGSLVPGGGLLRGRGLGLSGGLGFRGGGLLRRGGRNASHDIGKALQHLAGVGVDFILEVPQGGVAEFHLVVGGGLVQLRLRLAGDGVHFQGSGVLFRRVGGKGHADGQARRAGLPELFQFLGGEGGQIIGGQGGVEGLNVFDYGSLALRDAGGGGSQGLCGLGRGRAVGGIRGQGAVSGFSAEHLPELETQHQCQKGDGSRQQPAGQLLVVFLRGHGVHPPF